MVTEQDRALIKQFAEFKPPATVAELRSALDTFVGLMNAEPPQVGAFHENVELRPGVRADIAVPKGAGPHPVVVYLHGGGWVAGSPKTHGKLGKQFAEAGYLCVNVDYRLAPEHPFPAGLEDCQFAAKWVSENAGRYNGDASRMAIGGDSAGGNLTAATVTSLAAERSGPKFKAALLIYGVYDFPATMARAQGEAAMEMMAKAYGGAGYPKILGDPRISPLAAVRPGSMPPSFIIVGTGDALLPESKAIAEAMKKADIPHELHVFEEMPHGFIQMGMLSGCGEGLKLMFDFLKRNV
jgi:acetyl esterase